MQAIHTHTMGYANALGRSSRTRRIDNQREVFMSGIQQRVLCRGIEPLVPVGVEANHTGLASGQAAGNGLLCKQDGQSGILDQ